ncbi:MAG TPA: hypothetical protein VGH99_01440 [Pseudonocardia sp.]|jgi:hypothetical protein
MATQIQLLFKTATQVHRGAWDDVDDEFEQADAVSRQSKVNELVKDIFSGKSLVSYVTSDGTYRAINHVAIEWVDIKLRTKI